MANHDHPTHVPCLFSMMMSGRSRLSLSNQSLFSFLTWVVDQINQRHSPDLTDSSALQYLYSFVRSFQWNCVFLPRRRFVSGAFPCRRWFFRLSTGDCPLTQGYGGFTWVFDPGINRVLAEDEDIIKLVETKKNSHVQWINSGDLVPLFGHSISEFSAHRYPRSMLKDLRLATKRGLTAHPMIPEMYMDQRKVSYSQCFDHDYMRRRPHMMILHQPFMHVFLEYDASEDEFGFLLKIDEASISPRWPLDFWDWVLVLDNPNLFGSRVVDEWCCDLPFLFEVLSVKKVLSIQAHPCTTLAETLLTQLMSANSDETKEVISRLRFCEWWYLFTANSSFLELPASVYFLQWKQSWGRKLFIILCVWIGISRTKERATVSFFVLLPSQRYHYVVYYISELQIDTLSSKRFAKIKFSHVMLHSNRLREKSNLKLENSSSSERKASSNSTVFFLVYGTYNCVCNYLCYCIISL